MSGGLPVSSGTSAGAPPFGFSRAAVSPAMQRLTTASGVGYSATRYALQRIRGSPWIRMRTRHTGPLRVMSR
nr:MAG TPA: hypothetical protein [Caudoviricetes sp.]